MLCSKNLTKIIYFTQMPKKKLKLLNFSEGLDGKNIKKKQLLANVTQNTYLCGIL